MKRVPRCSVPISALVSRSGIPALTYNYACSNQLLTLVFQDIVHCFMFLLIARVPTFPDAPTSDVPKSSTVPKSALPALAYVPESDVPISIVPVVKKQPLRPLLLPCFCSVNL